MDAKIWLLVSFKWFVDSLDWIPEFLDWIPDLFEWIPDFLDWIPNFLDCISSSHDRFRIAETDTVSFSNMYPVFHQLDSG